MKYYLIQEIYDTKGKKLSEPVRITGDSIDKQWIKQQMDAAFSRMLIDYRNQIKPGSIRISETECSLELPIAKYVYKIAEVKPRVYSSEDMLVGLVVKYKGDWDKIVKAVKNRESLQMDEYDRLLWGYNAAERSNILTLLNEKYPIYLRNIYKPPFALFYKGDINLLSDRYVRVTVVTDNILPTDLLTKAVKDITDLPGRVVVVTNDFALIHRIKTIQPNRRVILVKDCGLDRDNCNLLPLDNDDLIISEVPYGISPKKNSAAQAARIFAGLASHILVVSCNEKGTALTTVLLGLEFDREIMVYPTFPEWKNLQNNNLIAQGAELVENAKDIVELMAL